MGISAHRTFKNPPPFGRLPTKRHIVMKKKNLLLLVPITLSAALFIGYRAWDGLRTDNTPPQISVSQETLRTSVSAPRSSLLQGITAQDDRDGDVTESLLVENITMEDSNGTVTVSIAAFDQSGNVAKATRTAQYSDYQCPRFYLSQAMLYPFNTTFDLMNAISAEDPLDGDIQHRIRATSLDDTAVTYLGDHQVEFRVTNSLGDTVRLTLPVTVYSADSYGLSVQLTDYLVYLKSGQAFDPDDYLLSATRGINTVSLEDGIPENYSVRTTGDVNTRVPGVYPVDYTVTYIQETITGTQYISGLSRLIVIVED